MIKYKEGILEKMADRGYTANYMRRNKIMAEATMQNIREGKNITTSTLNIICLVLKCQPSDVLEVVATDEEKIKYF